MSFGFLVPAMLIGMALLAIPPIIHLLNRRRYQVVDWGAMQFLQLSEVTRRRLMIEELLLMAIRMGLLAVLVLALASPFRDVRGAGAFGSRPNRDVVILFDGSYSMGSTGDGPTPHEAAQEWARAFLDDLAAGDGVAVFQAKQQVVPVVAELSHDLERVRRRVADLPPPAGGCDWKPALQAAHAVLAKSQRAEREIILLSDGQHFGWADKDSLFRWELLADELGLHKPEAPGAPPRPRVWVVNLAADRKAEAPNWSLAPLRSTRPVVPVDREITLKSDLVLHGQSAYTPPHRLRLEIDGKPVRELKAPARAELQKGQVPFSFTHRFTTPGSHLVTVLLEPDPPPERRPPGYAVKDRVPGDNRQDFSVEVIPSVPVLLVDGDPSPAPRFRGSDFLRDALSPARDRTPSVRTKVVSVSDFDPALLGGEVHAGKPRVLILANVARLNKAQQEAVDQFLADGGGVLVALGDRVEADAYNQDLYRGGEGWLPARLDGMEGDEAQRQNAVRPAPGSTNHPALELFRGTPAGGLADAVFPRWWKLTTPGKHAAGVPVAALRSATAEYPFLVERAYRAGRVLLCSVPLDNSWGTNLPDLLAFVPLAHELVYYLAGARSAEFNLQPGQPLRYRLETDANLEGFTLQPPVGEEKPLSTVPDNPSAYPAQLVRQLRGALLVYEGTRETGTYRLKTPEGATVHYVVGADPRESDLTPLTQEEREKVAKVVPLTYEDDRAKIVEAPAEGTRRQEYWWWLLFGLVALLCGEVWMTRRLVKNR
jgi:hypothetical protein